MDLFEYRRGRLYCEDLPVADLAPDLAHPVLGLTLGEVARAALATTAAPPQPVEMELS
jgi:hypothetical protein